MNCKYCGYQLFDNEQICRNCGASISRENIQNNYCQQGESINSYENTGAPRKCKLILKRKKSFVASLVSFDVYIDNIKVGKIKNGEIIELDITIGRHEISINKNNPVNIEIKGDTTADVIVMGANDFGISNISGQNTNFQESKLNINYIEKSNKTSNFMLYMSIGISIISIFMMFTINRYIKSWMYVMIIGYSIVNIIGIKNQQKQNYNNSEMYKSALIKNVISIVICVIMEIITVYIKI